MTPNIQQTVMQRRSSSIGRRSWNIPRRHRSSSRSFERGSVNSSTLTVGFGVLALALVGLLGFFYLQQVVNTASQGTDVRELESQIVELREQQRELELEGAELRSLQTVSDRVDKLNLVATDKVSYLASVDNRVAVAE